MKQFYYHELPDGYIAQKTVDALDKKTAIWLNVTGSALTLLSVVLFILARQFSLFSYLKEDSARIINVFIAIGVFFVSYLVYLVFHELVHGLFYKLFTKEKLKFGISLTCAYCGVPGIFVKKYPMMVILMAPFTIFTLLFLPICILLPSNIWFLSAVLLFSTHLGGCVGDLYDFLIFLSMPKDALLSDTGPKQVFYVRNS